MQFWSASHSLFPCASLTLSCCGVMPSGCPRLRAIDCLTEILVESAPHAPVGSSEELEAEIQEEDYEDDASDLLRETEPVAGGRATLCGRATSCGALAGVRQAWHVLLNKHLRCGVHFVHSLLCCCCGCGVVTGVVTGNSGFR